MSRGIRRECHMHVGESATIRQERVPGEGRIRVPGGGNERVPRGGRRECHAEAGEGARGGRRECHVEAGESAT